jgi:hypothetical protein
MISRRRPVCMSSLAWRCNSRTRGPLSPTINRVGVRTTGRAVPAKSGHLPRETTAPTSSGRRAAAMSAAAAPVLAPNRLIWRWRVGGWPRAQSTAPTRRSANRSISNRSSHVRMSTAASSGVRRSKSSVARPASWRTSATEQVHGPWWLLPLPWAKTISASASRGARAGPQGARLLPPLSPHYVAESLHVSYAPPTISAAPNDGLRCYR